ncbi:hypothetical protein PHLGIDRAFT_298819 [Phlebiopsis gigantea 11061_1 CR5-6]|uniref:GED domain-containing protein n=1 Tax=Phlebiopsis gigantea (strain 11061_1 CR5-6) TaxID=745531 RepID=A0A0C3PBK6_PHLG1|nr:hypothetical protein PHLGIDRAFT_298819 [Phlebiopsis gigantea 11061_1 CR5-6]
MSQTDISSSNFAAWSRQLITLITRLRALGAQADFDLPRIAVIGNQSAGKSSLVEAISGISVPRAHGTCTRCPMECRLQSNSPVWKCQVRLRRETDETGQRVPVTEEQFGEPIYIKSQLEEMIRRAQLAILNPSLPAKFFESFDTKSLSPGQKPPGSEKQLAFSNNVVCLDLYGPDLPDLSFIDLPGIISTVEKGEDKQNITAVRNMVQDHIKGNTLILLTITMRAHLAQIADPSGSRTIGVLTKPDLIQEGEEDTWLNILEGASHPLKHGYFITKHPSPKELDEQITHEEAREREAEFFDTRVPWSNKSELRMRMGTPNLTRELSNLLGGLINDSLPGLRANADDSLSAVQKALATLPPPPSDNPMLELLGMIKSLVSEVDALVRGTEGSERLLQQCRPAHQQLKYDILGTAPNFRPFRTAAVDKQDFTVEVDEDDAVDKSRKRKRTGSAAPIYLEDVRAHIQSSLTRQLPFNVPFSVKVGFIERCFSEWEKFCVQCFDAVHCATTSELGRLARAHFGGARGATLLADVRIHCDDLVKRHREETLKFIRFVLELEDPPFTVNDHYFSACRDKYLAQYKAAGKPPLGDADKTLVQNALSSLALLGITANVNDLAKLHKEDQYEEELIVMAETAAYFRVAYKRVIDNIPRIIDHGFMRAVARDLHGVLVTGLGLSTEKATEQAAFYLAEDMQVRADRKSLQQRKEKLDAVLRELSRFQHTVAPSAKIDLAGSEDTPIQGEEEESTTASSASPPPVVSASSAAPTSPPRPASGSAQQFSPLLGTRPFMARPIPAASEPSTSVLGTPSREQPQPSAASLYTGAFSGFGQAPTKSVFDFRASGNASESNLPFPFTTSGSASPSMSAAKAASRVTGFGLFGQAASSSEGAPTTPASASGGGLFGTGSAATTPTSGGGLFGSVGSAPTAGGTQRTGQVEESKSQKMAKKQLR